MMLNLSIPIFTKPSTTTQTDLTFQLTFTNEKGTTSEPDEVTVTVSPISAPLPPKNLKPSMTFLKTLSTLHWI